MSRQTPTRQQTPPRKPLVLRGLGSASYRPIFLRLARRAWPSLFPHRLHSQVSVAFVPPVTMARVNAQMRGRHGVTTVLAFPYEASGSADPFVGEILLCQSAIRPWAAEQGLTPRQATHRLFIHALLHLAGHDHKNDRDARRMEALEDHYLAPRSRAI
jgi:rRNA maturation RNase YbeY